MSGMPLFKWRKESPRSLCLPLHGVVVAFLVTAATGSVAEEMAVMGSEEQFFEELPVVLTVTRLPQTQLELPASMTTIDRRMIEASGVTDIPELLRLVAGFQIAHVDGSRYAVTYHGLGDDYARRIQVLVDGRSVYMPATSSVDWMDLPLSIEDVDRIEVLRGPNGVAFGDNSFNGVVNIVTQEAKAARGSFARVMAGRDNYRRAVARQGFKLGDLDLRLTFEHQRDDGFDDALKKSGTISSLQDDKQSNKVTLRGDLRTGVNDYLHIFAGANMGTRGYGYNPDTGNPDDYLLEPGFDIHNRRHYEQIRWRHINSSENELQVQLYHIHTNTSARYETLPTPVFGPPPAPPLPPLGIDMSILADRHSLELEHRFRVNSALRLVWGGELRFDEVTAPGFLNTSEAMDNTMTRGFAHGEWRINDDYLLNLGAMVENNDIAGTHVSPRCAVNRRLSENHAMRISATRAYRTPAILEEYADYAAELVGDNTQRVQLWLSQGGLESEQITAYEIGWMGNLGSVRNQYDVKLFQEKIRNIVSHPLLRNQPSTLQSFPFNLVTSDPTYFYNKDWVDLKGVEGQLKMVATDDTMLSFGYSYLNGEGTYTKRLNAEQVETITHNVPSHTFSWLTEHNFDDHWRGSLAFYHVQNIAFWHDTQINTVDMRVARRFKHGDNEGELSLVARDLTGAYFDFQDERVMQPRLYLSMAYRF